MKIGVDATCWANGRGYGRFTRELLGRMVQLAPAEEWVFFVDSEAERAFDLDAARCRLVRVRQDRSPTRAALANGNRSPVDMLRFTRAVRRERPDVFFSPSVYTYFPLPPGLPALVAIHDTIAERFPALTLPTARARLFWKAKVRLAALQARLVLTVSEYSARELDAVLNIRRSRIRVAAAAAAAAYRPCPPGEIADAAARYGLSVGDRWFTYVGGFNPHKRLDTIVRAHAAAARATSGKPPHLLLVGTTDGDVFHGNRAEIEALIRASGTEPLVHWTGYLPDDALRPLHAGATALVLVSEAEGFGLPAVEAAASGAPVIATTASPLPELLEGGGFFVRPGDEQAVTAAMLRLLDEPGLRDAMGARARERACTLSWTDAARTTLNALYEAAATRVPTPWEVIA